MAYESLDELPIWNYNKILLTGDYKKYGVDSVEDWDKIQEEFYNDIGYSDKYFEVLRKKMRLIQLKCDYYLRGKKSALTFAKVLETDIEDMSRGEKTTFEDLVVLASKKAGFRIPIKKVSVKEFYSYLK